MEIKMWIYVADISRNLILQNSKNTYQTFF